jgi:hypothetical protein
LQRSRWPTCWLFRLPSPVIERRIAHALPLGVWSRVRLTIDHISEQALRFDVHDLHPEELETRGLPRELRLRDPKKGVREVPVAPTATRRPRASGV